jgi:outer membrane lipoprotein carrier protein
MTGTPGTRLSAVMATLTLGLAGLVLALGVAIQAARGGEATPLAESPVNAVLERMRHAYDGHPGVHASFVQTNTGMSYFEPLVMKGTLALKKPRRVRMEYLTPRPKTYLSDGATLWIVDEGDRTVTRSRTQVEGVGRMFDFLTGSADVAKDFVITPEVGSEKAEGFDVLRLKPRLSDAAFSMVFVRVHPETGLVHAVVTITPFGDRSETVLSDVRTDVDLPDEGFVYTDRDGYRIVDLD